MAKLQEDVSLPSCSPVPSPSSSPPSELEANQGSAAEKLQPAWPPHMQSELKGTWKEIGPGKAVAHAGENIDTQGKALDVAGVQVL